MADDQDPSQKTEEPTGKKLEDAAQKGQVAKSQEINHWFMIGGATLVVVLFSDPMAARLQDLLLPFLASPHDISVDSGRLVAHLADAGLGVAMLLLPAVGLLAAAALLGSLLQHRPVISAERLIPKLSKLSPAKGLKRIFSVNGVMDFSKGVIKLAIIGSIGTMLVWPEVDQMPLMVSLEPTAILTTARELTLRMLGGMVAVLAVIAGTDFFYQKWDHIKQLRMSKQEVRDEAKQSEGDPMVKARIKGLRLERSRKRMMAAVPEADVVVTNPTHFAVALKYDGAAMTAPRVVAKGQDLVAMRIRELAAEHGVPLVENPPLARALHAACEIDQEIPVEHYRAVAEVIGYVMRLKRGPAGRRPQP